LRTIEPEVAIVESDPMHIAVVVPVMKSGERGGAEALYKGLIRGLRETSNDVDRIDVIVDESSFEAILESYEKCANLDLADYDLVISTKGPTYAVRHRAHVSYLLHTIRVFYDMFHREYGKGTPEQFRQRRLIHALDKSALHPDRVRKHFVNGHIPYRRLYEVDLFWQQIKFEVLHHPPALQGFREPRAGEYVFVPGRLHRWKRVDLIIKALQHIKHDIPLRIAGTGEDEANLRALAAGDRRIEFLGRVSDEQLLDLYAGALVVPFVPVNEDYGLITIEAFRSKRPVITCIDSGEPTYFVKNGVTGFVVKPEPEAIAQKINYLIEHPDHGAEMGEKGFSAVAHITWDAMVAKLLSSIALPRKQVRKWERSPAIRRPIKVVITDNQCIEPAVGGGRLRLLGLYSTLTEGIEATYVGTYDWPGPGYRELQLSKRLREIDIPQSREHFVLNDHLNSLLPGKTIIDVTIPWLVWSSPQFVDTVRKRAAEAEVVIFSHPWMYGCVQDIVREGGKLIIYDSQNCEAVLREELLATNEFGACLAQSVKWIEGQLCRESDLILACCEEDKQTFVEVYEVKPQKIIVVPNGVNVRAIRPASATARARARKNIAVQGFVALFIGSAYPPNMEAVGVILNQLAPANPEVSFVIVGGAGDQALVQGFASTVPSNVRLLGAVGNAERNEAYAAADIAINPMLTGSGTNIKMLDFLAAGLPTITTLVGARGIINRDDACFIVDHLDRFSDWIKRLCEDSRLRARLAGEGRKLAEEMYDWRRISAQLGRLIIERSRAKSTHSVSPYFSVIIPSYERPASLTRLLELLSRQVFSDFEVVVVDQSAIPLDLDALRCNFPIQYIHTTERGPAKARNLGIKHAKGPVLAFTDDDCEPDVQWLVNAYKYFQDDSIVGLEGLVQSDMTDTERYRIVTNQGFEGVGFMTANLFLRKEIVDKLGGFDERFERPFREDTDLAWRALAYGRIPFVPDVKVLHPAEPKDIRRESGEGRTWFFEYDPILFHKHPERYLKLLKGEGHYTRTPGFWEHFMRGMVRHRLDVSIEELREFTTSAQYALLGELSKLLCSRPLQDTRPDKSLTCITDEPLMLPQRTGKNTLAASFPDTTLSEKGAPPMDHLMNGEIVALMQHLQPLLTSYSNLEYGRQVNPVDAFFTYRLILGRNPDLVNELPHILTDTRTFREFLVDLLGSDEFSHCTGFIPPNRVFMVELQDFRLWFNTSDRELGLVVATGQYEPESVELVKRIVRPGMTCIDIGAHIGFYTCLIASLFGEIGKVYAFEPMRVHFELLLKNIEENRFQQRVITYQLACSDVHGNLRVSKVSNMFVVGQAGSAEQLTVEAVRLDDVIADSIDFVKLDVEGHEPAVISGMRSIISRDKPIILSEINEYWLRSCSHSSGAEYVALLMSLGYEVFDVKNLKNPLSEGSLKLDILDTIDVVAFPQGSSL
jgi:FkbM family methyltransferase